MKQSMEAAPLLIAKWIATGIHRCVTIHNASEVVRCGIDKQLWPLGGMGVSDEGCEGHGYKGSFVPRMVEGLLSQAKHEDA